MTWTSRSCQLPIGGSRRGNNRGNNTCGRYRYRMSSAAHSLALYFRPSLLSICLGAALSHGFSSVSDTIDAVVSGTTLLLQCATKGERVYTCAGTYKADAMVRAPRPSLTKLHATKKRDIMPLIVEYFLFWHVLSAAAVQRNDV